MPPATARRRGGHPGDRIFAWACRGAAVLLLLLLGAVILALSVAALPAFRAFGAAFLTSADWDPARQAFGAADPLCGTAVTTALAIILAVPLAFGTAFYLAEVAPVPLRRPVGAAIELLAAVPSVVYGMWGVFVILPFFADNVQPALAGALGGVPVLGALFRGPPFGAGLLVAAFILAIMILPFIAATMRNVFEQVPRIHKESAYALGATTWEVMKGVVLPATRLPIIGAIMLGLGRALGETIAVALVVGAATRGDPAASGGGGTIASLIALDFGEGGIGGLRLASLLALGLVLLLLSFAVLAASRRLLRPRLKA